MKRFISVILSMFLLLPLCVASVSATTSVSMTWNSGHYVTSDQGVVYSNYSVYGGTSKHTEKVTVLEFDPADGYIPMAFVGNAGSLKYLSSQYSTAKNSYGYEVHGMINGTYWTTSNSTLEGLVISNGAILCGQSYYPNGYIDVVAFDSNGKANFVTSALEYDININGTELNNAIHFVNKKYSAASSSYNGKLFYYDSALNTSTSYSSAGYEVLCEKVDGTELSVGNTLYGKVISVTSGTYGGTTIASNQFVIFAKSSSSYAGYLSSLSAGDSINVNVNETIYGAESVMNNANSAMVNIGFILKDGVDQTDVYSSIGGHDVDGTYARWTVFGVKADGSYVYLTSEGGSTGVSSRSLTLKDVAATLLKLGCVTAVRMDGGGSTGMYVSNTGSGSAGEVMTSGRAVADCLMIVKRSSLVDSSLNQELQNKIKTVKSLTLPSAEIKRAAYEAEAFLASGEAVASDVLNVMDSLSFRDELYRVLTTASSVPSSDFTSSTYTSLSNAYGSAYDVWADSTSTEDEIVNAIEKIAKLLSRSLNLVVSEGAVYSTTAPNRGDMWDDDGIRLTDGNKGDLDGGSVKYSAWNGSSVEIVIDLGWQRMSNTYVAYLAGCSAWGIAGVEYSDLQVFISNNNSYYQEISTTSSVVKTDSDGTWDTYTITATADKMYDARYVKIVINSGGGFVWTDEVEVKRVSDTEIIEENDGCAYNRFTGLDYLIETGSGGAVSDTYTANLTDGSALSEDYIWTQGAWFGFSSGNCDNGYGSILFDLGTDYNISGARIHLLTNTAAAITVPKNLEISVSSDNINFTTYSKQFSVNSEDGDYWTELWNISDLWGRYIRISFERTSAWVFMNEIELYGSVASVNTNGNLAYKADYTTSSDGSVHSETTFQDDNIRLTDGTKSYSDGTTDKYSGWNASKVEITVDLGQVRTTGRYSVYSISDFWGISAPEDLKISVSEDGNTYIDIDFKAVSEIVGSGVYMSSSGTEKATNLNCITVYSNSLVSARYVKFTVIGTGNFIWIDEIEVYAQYDANAEVRPEDIDPSVNLAMYGTYTTSSNGSIHSEVYYQDDGTRLNDGVAGGIAGHSNSYAGWTASQLDITVDLGKARSSGTYIAYVASDFWGIASPTGLSVSISDDGVNFTEVTGEFFIEVINEGTSSSADAHVTALTVSLSELVKARYVKLTVIGVNFIWIDEVEIYAEVGRTAPEVSEDTSTDTSTEDNSETDVITGENVALGADYTIASGDGQAVNSTYTANLTDGLAAGIDYVWETGAWYGFHSNNTDNNMATVIIDLGSECDISGARLHYLNYSAAGIGTISQATVSVSVDGVNYTTFGKEFEINSEDGDYWTELAGINTIARYVKISFARSGWGFINEIEVYGAKIVNLAQGADYTTSSNGSVHSLSTYQDDGVRLTDGSKSNADGGSNAYSGWTATNVEIVVDLGAEKETNSYSVYTGSDFWGISAPADMKVYVSNDGVNFTAMEISAVTEILTDGSSSGECCRTVYEISVDEYVSARYVKFELTSVGNFIWIDEVEVYGIQ